MEKTTDQQQQLNSHKARERELMGKIDQLELRLESNSSGKLSETEELRLRLEMAIDLTKLGTWDYNPITGTLVWSDICKDIYGLPYNEEPLFETFNKQIFSEDTARVSKAINDALIPTESRHYDITYRIVRLDNQEVRWIKVIGKTLFDDRQTAYRFFGTVVDITEQKEAEEQKAKLAAIIQSSDDAIISKTLEGIITSWNDSAERLFGYKAEEIVGTSITRLIPPDRQDEEPRIISRLKQGERIEHFETKRLRKDKSIIDISLSISPVRDTEGKVIGVSKIARDIGDRKLAETLIKERDDYFKLALESANLGTFDIDLNKHSVIWDKRARELFGIFSDVTGTEQVYLDAIHDADRQKVIHSMDLVSKRKQTSYDLEFRTLGLEDKKLRWVRAMGKASYDEQGNAIRLIGTFLDITNQKLEELKKNDFIAIVSHELKTPLTSVKSYIQVLLAKAMQEDNTFSITALSRAEMQANKMTTMINDFLSLARLEESKIIISKQKFDLHPLMLEIVNDAQFLSSGHNIKLVDCKDLWIFADKDKIGQILLNLLSNAIKYSPKGSTVTIGCKKGERKVRIYVKDQGIGISSSDQKHLFERFYRVENEKLKTISGFGIGLYLVSELLKNHGSKIEVKSKEGEGSEFFFYLDIE